MKAKLVSEHINEFERTGNIKKSLDVGIFNNVPEDILDQAVLLNKLAISNGYSRMSKEDMPISLLGWEKYKGSDDHIVIRLYWSKFWNQYSVSRAMRPRDGTEDSIYNNVSIFNVDEATKDEFWKIPLLKENVNFKRGGNAKESVGIGLDGKYGKEMADIYRKLKPFADKYGLSQIEDNKLEQPNEYIVWEKKVPHNRNIGENFFRRYLTLKKDHYIRDGFIVQFNSASFSDKGAENSWDPKVWESSEDHWERYFMTERPLTESNHNSH